MFIKIYHLGNVKMKCVFSNLQNYCNIKKSQNYVLLYKLYSIPGNTKYLKKHQTKLEFKIRMCIFTNGNGISDRSLIEESADGDCCCCLVPIRGQRAVRERERETLLVCVKTARYCTVANSCHSRDNKLNQYLLTYYYYYVNLLSWCFVQ